MMDKIMMHGIGEKKVKKMSLAFEKGIYKLANETQAIEKNT